MVVIVEFCCCSVAQNCVQLFATPWTAAPRASLSFIICQSLLKLISTESMMPSNHLILCHSLLLSPSIFPSFGVFSNESALCIRWPKNWSFSFSISPSGEYSGLISFMTDWFDLLACRELSRVLFSTTVQKHQFFNAQPSLWSSSHIWYKTPGKTIALTIWTFVGKVVCLLFNMLSRFVIAILPRSKHHH